MPVHPKEAPFGAAWLDTFSTKNDLGLGDRTQKWFKQFLAKPLCAAFQASIPNKCYGSRSQGWIRDSVQREFCKPRLQPTVLTWWEGARAKELEVIEPTAPQ